MQTDFVMVVMWGVPSIVHTTVCKQADLGGTKPRF